MRYFSKIKHHAIVAIANYKAVFEIGKEYPKSWFKTYLGYLHLNHKVRLTDEGPLLIGINNWCVTTGQLIIGKGWHDAVIRCYYSWNEHYQKYV